MAVEVLFSNGGHENTAFNDMLCLLMEKVAIETAMVVGKSDLCLVLAMGTLSNGLKMLGNEIDINQGDEDSFPVQVMRKGSKGETQVPSQKDDGETDDDDDDEDEDADEQDDDDVGEVPSDEGKENEGNEGSEDELGVNGEGGSDDEDDDGEDDDEDDDEDEDEEDEEDDEDEEEAPEPPSKKRK